MPRSIIPNRAAVIDRDIKFSRRLEGKVNAGRAIKADCAHRVAKTRDDFSGTPITTALGNDK